MDHRRTTLNKPGRWRGGAAGLALPLVCVGLLAATTPVARAQGGARFGGRLSVMPVAEDEFDVIVTRGKG